MCQFILGCTRSFVCPPPPTFTIAIAEILFILQTVSNNTGQMELCHFKKRKILFQFNILKETINRSITEGALFVHR
jgi:hypothetical protein